MRIVGAIVLSLLANTGGAADGKWQRASVDGVDLEYRLRGTGEPIVFVHAGLFAEWFEPLLKEAVLREHFQLLTYHRVGYAGSSPLTTPTSIVEQAAQLNSLLRELGIERVHLVGHSSGGLIAIQLALDHPERVQTLALLEPALSIAGASSPGIAKAGVQYRAGDLQAAMDTFMQTVAGADYRAALDRALPGAFDAAGGDANAFFAYELPEVRAWSFASEDARRLHVPVLAVLGARSDQVSPIWRQRQNLLVTSLPQVESFVLPGATHLLHLQNPRAMADRLASFVSAHPTSRPRSP